MNRENHALFRYLSYKGPTHSLEETIPPQPSRFQFFWLKLDKAQQELQPLRTLTTTQILFYFQGFDFAQGLRLIHLLKLHKLLLLGGAFVDLILESRRQKEVDYYLLSIIYYLFYLFYL